MTYNVFGGTLNPTLLLLLLLLYLIIYTAFPEAVVSSEYLLDAW